MAAPAAVASVAGVAPTRPASRRFCAASRTPGRLHRSAFRGRGAAPGHRGSPSGMRGSASLQSLVRPGMRRYRGPRSLDRERSRRLVAGPPAARRLPRRLTQQVLVGSARRASVTRGARRRCAASAAAVVGIGRRSGSRRTRRGGPRRQLASGRRQLGRGSRGHRVGRGGRRSSVPAATRQAARGPRRSSAGGSGPRPPATASVAAVGSAGGTQGTPPGRWAAASNSSTEPATAALSDPTLPRIGMRTDEVDAPPDVARDAPALAADDERQRTAEVRIAEGERRRLVGTHERAGRGRGGRPDRRPGRRWAPAADAPRRRPRP